MIEYGKRNFSFTGREPWLVLGLACLAIHLIFNAGYGIFRDELYFQYASAATELAWAGAMSISHLWSHYLLLWSARAVHREFFWSDSG